MSMLLKNVKDISSLRRAIHTCRGDVILRSCDGTESFNMKSVLSEFIALGKLCDAKGDTYEFFCMDKNDEPKLLAFFYELKSEN